MKAKVSKKMDFASSLAGERLEQIIVSFSRIDDQSLGTLRMQHNDGAQKCQAHSPCHHLHGPSSRRDIRLSMSGKPEIQSITCNRPDLFGQDHKFCASARHRR